MPAASQTADALSAPTASSPETLAGDYERVRSMSDAISDPLAVEDQVVQTMPDVSPTRWHRAHTTWFFETFVLKPNVDGYRSPNDAFEVLFNSYYNSVGEQFPRDRRGHLTRPTVAEVDAYRVEIDRRMLDVMPRLDAAAREVVTLGLHHEQQHQELMLTDIKHVLAANPLDPVYRDVELQPSVAHPQGWVRFEGGLSEIGHDSADGGFFFDNEQPRHRAFCEPFELAGRPVTCDDWINFIEDGGYCEPDHWTALGWATVQAERWTAPMYWTYDADGWSSFTLAGRRPIDRHAPVTHVSWLEADAFARWSGARLPTEQEWERACLTQDLDSAIAEGQFIDDAFPHPQSSGNASTELTGMFGGVWEWTSSPYTPYPGFVAAKGALGEYNGKFMTQQYVLRGGSCATSRSHIRPTYRNFFPPDARWQFSGLRLARDAS